MIILSLQLNSYHIYSMKNQLTLYMMVNGTIYFEEEDNVKKIDYIRWY